MGVALGVGVGVGDGVPVGVGVAVAVAVGGGGAETTGARKVVRGVVNSARIQPYPPGPPG